jgi:hypothetical protein
MLMTTAEIEIHDRRSRIGLRSNEMIGKYLYLPIPLEGRILQVKFLQSNSHCGNPLTQRET